jgi:YidC/Oxa1 family membrane protein insertase
MNFGDLYFTIVTQPLLNLLQLLENLTRDTGIAIILIAAVINFALWPLFHRNYINSQKLKYLQPELDRIQENFKDKPQEMLIKRSEVMRKHGVSTGTFWVVLLQLPFLIALYDIINRITQTSKIATHIGSSNFADIIKFLKDTDLTKIGEVIGNTKLQASDRDYIVHIFSSIYSWITPSGIGQFGDKLFNYFTLGSTTTSNGLPGILLAIAVSLSSLMLGLYMFRLAPKANLPEPPKAKPLMKNKDPNAPDFATTLQKSIEIQSIYVFPVIYLLANLNLPVGLVLYFLGSSLSGLIRQFFITQYYARHGEKLMESILDSDPSLRNPAHESEKITADPAIREDDAVATKVIDVKTTKKIVPKKKSKKKVAKRKK